MTTNELTNTIENGTKKIIGELAHKFQVYGFWSILLICVGIFIGITYYNKTKSSDMKNAIQLGGFIQDGKVYDIKLRPIQ